MKYTVTNHYGVRGETTHRTPEAALKAANKREGIGWEVHDDSGNRWDWPCWPIDADTKAVISS